MRVWLIPTAVEWTEQWKANGTGLIANKCADLLFVLGSTMHTDSIAVVSTPASNSVHSRRTSMSLEKTSASDGSTTTLPRQTRLSCG